MKELSGNAILSLPVQLHGIELGRPADVLLDRDGLRVAGIYNRAVPTAASSSYPATASY